MGVIALGADHAGFVLKEELKAWLRAQGHDVLDYGTDSGAAVDYPDYAVPVAEAVASGTAARGVLVCGTGVGMAIAANKVHGVRAAVGTDVEVARLSREHNDTNVIAFGARITTREEALAILDTWLQTGFAGGRHTHRLEKLAALERLGLDRRACHAQAR